MKKRTISILCAIALCTLGTRAQHDIRVHDDKTGREEVIDLPEGMTYEIDSLLREWNTRNYLGHDEKCESSDENPSYSKEEYIARYLNRCRDYLDSLADYRRTTLRLVKEKRLEELVKKANSEQVIRKEQDAFYADFDQAFLTLFPDFIEKFNALLQPTERVVPKHDNHLNTELRIYALIRLGVADSARIAHFLNFSLTTVYNYRSKMRNKALGNPTDFERAVSEL